MAGTFQYDSALSYDAQASYDAFAPTQPAQQQSILPHLSAAMKLAPDGSFAWLPQDTLDEVAQSVQMIVGTQQGERTVVPSFGIPDQTFTGPNKSDFATAIGRWETRAQVGINIVTHDDGVANVTVSVAIAGNNVVV